MYDELVKRLRDAAKMSEALAVLLPHSEGNAMAKLYKEAADAIEELTALSRRQEVELVKLTGELASKPRWIPVTERLPEVRTWVLCYCRANSFDVFRMTDEGNWQYGNRSIYMKGYVTHWMPLPPAPKEESYGV